MLTLLLVSMLPAAAETTVSGRVASITPKVLALVYSSRDGRTLVASLKLTKDTATVRDGKPVDRNGLRPGDIVRVTVRARTAIRITLPDTPKPEEKPDEEAIVDGDVLSIKDGILTVRKIDGKELEFRITADTEIRLDGNRAEVSALKRGQSIRAFVFKRARTATRVNIYEVSSRPR